MLTLAKLMESPKALKMLCYGHIHATRPYVPYKDPYDVQSREDRPAPDPVAPAPQEPAENPLLAECEELIEVRVTIERLEKRVTELDAENAALRAKLQSLEAKPAAEPRPANRKPSAKAPEPAATPKPSKEPANPRVYIDDAHVYWVDIGNPAPNRRPIYFVRRSGKAEGVPRFSKSLGLDNLEDAVAEARRLKEAGEIENFLAAASKTKKRVAA